MHHEKDVLRRVEKITFRHGEASERVPHRFEVRLVNGAELRIARRPSAASARSDSKSVAARRVVSAWKRTFPAIFGALTRLGAKELGQSHDTPR